MLSPAGNKGVSIATLLFLVLCCCGEYCGLGDGVMVTLGVALIIGTCRFLFGISSFAIRVSSMWVWFSTERLKIGEVSGSGLVDGFGGSVVVVTALGACILLLLLPLPLEDDDNGL